MFYEGSSGVFTITKLKPETTYDITVTGTDIYDITITIERRVIPGMLIPTICEKLLLLFHLFFSIFNTMFNTLNQ